MADEEEVPRKGKVRRYAGYGARAPGAAHEKVREAGKWLIEAPFRLIKLLLKWFGGWLLAIIGVVLIILVIFAFILGGVFAVRCWQTNVCGTVFDAVIDFFGGVKVAQPVVEFGVGTFFQYIINPVKLMEPGGPFSLEEKVEVKERYGIDIISFRPFYTDYRFDEDIQYRAVLDVSTPPDADIKVKFFCKMETYNYEPSSRSEGVGVSIETARPQETKDYGYGKSDVDKTTFFAGNKYSDFEVVCDFPGGIKGETWTDIKRKEVVFEYDYSFSQRTSFSPYSKQQKERLDVQAEERGVVKDGPLILELVVNSNPLYMVDERGIEIINRLNIRLKNNPLVWNGHLKKLNYVRISTPRNVELIEEEGCDFTGVGGAYTLNAKLVNNVNIDCDLIEVLRSFNFATYEDCIDRFKNEIRGSCKFRLTEAPETAVKIQPFILDSFYDYRGREVSYVTAYAK